MKKFFLFAVIALSAFATRAQTADEILDKHFTAIGGADKWKKMESLRMVGTGTAQGMEFSVTTTKARPNKARVESDMMGQNVVMSCYDGTTGWSKTPWGTMGKPTKMGEAEQKAAQSESFDGDLIDYKTKGSTVTLIGTDSVEGAKCFKLSLKKASGDEKFYYVNAKTYLIDMVQAISTRGPNKGMSETLLSDYKDVNGLKMPYSIETKMKGETVFNLKFDTIEVDPKIDATVFVFPK